MRAGCGDLLSALWWKRLVYVQRDQGCNRGCEEVSHLEETHIARMPHIVNRTLRRRSNPQPVMMNATAGGKKTAICKNELSDGDARMSRGELNNDENNVAGLHGDGKVRAS